MNKLFTLSGLLLIGALSTQLPAQTVPGLLNYQGRVAVDGTNFTGPGQFRFALVNSNGTATFWSNDGTSTNGSEPAAAVPLSVQGGLYSVLLGDTALTNMTAVPATIFTNSDVRLRAWFNDGTNGSQLLTPDQRLAAVGYAQMATRVPDGAITGIMVASNSLNGDRILSNTITAGRIGANAVNTSELASNSVTSVKILDGAVTSSKLASGAVNSASLAAGALSAPITQTTDFLAAANNRYVLTATNSLDFSLPTGAPAGSVIEIAAGPSVGWSTGLVARETNSGLQWISVASSSDGSKLAAAPIANRLSTSEDGGNTWTEREQSRSWQAVASSSDGSKLVAAATSGQIYTSVDGGTNWTARETERNWRSVASSSDGSKLVAAVEAGQLYTSVDGGTNWTARETNRTWRSVASSSDGIKLVGAVNSGQLYTSTDSGTNWTARETNRAWTSVASSSDGSKLVAAVDGGQLYTSIDGGTNWTARETNRNWRSVASSSDGSKLVAAAAVGQLYASADGGTNWTAHGTNDNWRSVALSSDGSKIIGGVHAGFLYVGNLFSPQFSGAAGTLTRLQSLGDGTWGSLANANLAAGAVGSAQLASNAVTSANIAAGAVGTAQLASNAVTSASIASGAVGTAQLASNAVTSASIASGAVGTAQLANNAVTSVQIFDGTISNPDIAAAANIDAAKLGTGVVSTAEFNRLAGVTNALQTQLDGKLPTAGGTLGGSLTVPSLTYASPQTRYVAVPASAFRPHDFATNSTISYSSGSSGSAFLASGTGTARATAPVYLPQNATITGMKFVAFDNNSTNNITMVLRVAAAAGIGSTGLLTNVTAGASASAQTINSTPLSHTVDNDGQRLFLSGFWEAASGSSIEIRQITITYTVTTPLP